MTLSVTVVSLTQLSFQWYFDNSPIHGATEGMLTLHHVTVKDAGYYYVNVVNAGGSVNSGKAKLTVNDTAPVANSDAYYCLQNNTRTVASPGVLANDTDAENDTLSAVLVTNVLHGTLALSSDGGFSYLPNTNFYGVDSFSYCANDGAYNSGIVTVTLTVLAPPSIISPPHDQQIITNNTANFAVGVSGTFPMHYQWLFHGAAIAGATNSALAVFNVQSTNAGDYTVVVTNVAGAVTSDVVLLNVLMVPAVSALDHSSVGVNSAQLEADINPQGSPTRYYFQYGMTTNYGSLTVTNDLPADTNGDIVALRITNLEPGSVYYYSVLAMNAGGSSILGPGMFTTTALPPVQLAGSAAVNQGSSTGQSMQLGLTSVSGASFTVLGSTNLMLPAASWTILGTMAETSPGHYEFTDSQAPTNLHYYYKIRSP